MNKTICLIGLIGLLIIPTYAIRASGFEQIEVQINQEISKGIIPSLAVAIAKNGKIVFEKA